MPRLPSALPPQPPVAALARQDVTLSVRAVAVATVVTAVLIAAPYFATAVVNDWIISAASLVILAIAWNIASNAGLISLGHSAFWGVGSYAAVLAANRTGMPLYVALLPAIVAGCILGAFLAIVTGRLRGIYFAISALAMSEGLRIAAVMLMDLTGGSEGIYVDPKLRIAPASIAALMIGGALVAFALSWWMSRTSWHYAFRAMRANESAAQMLGVAPIRFRVAVLMISGAMTGFAGGVSIWYGGFIDPNIAFDLRITILAQIAPILGGVNTLIGPVIGAGLAVVLSETTRIWLGTDGVSVLVYGLALVLCILYLPHGVWGAIRTRRRGTRP